MTSQLFASKKIIPFLVFFFIIISYCNSSSVFAQSDISFGATPFIRNYSPKEYQAGIINMAVKKDSKGIIYFANTKGVLQFDGQNWRTIEVPNVSFVRTLDIDEKNTVFIGAINQLGKLEPDSTGKLEFVSLLHLLDSADRNFGEIWKIKATPKGTFFVTDKYIFRYKDNKIKKWTTEGKYFYLVYYVNNEVYVLDRGSGLKKLENESLKFISNDEIIQSLGIYFMLPYSKTDKSEIIIGGNNSFLIYNPTTNEFRHFQTELTKEEMESIYNGILGKDGNYYISTIRYGLICINPKGKKLFQLTRKNGLETDKVYETEIDKQGNLWLALVNGIAKVEIGSPFKKFNEKNGLLGIVTAAKQHKGNFYVTTINGTYKYNKEKLLFEILEGTPHQSWKIEKLPIENDTLLIVATNTGIDRIDKNKLVRLFNTGASVAQFAVSKSKESTLYAGLLNQQGVYKLSYSNKNSEPSFEQVIPDITTEGLEIADNLLFVIDGEASVHAFEEKDSLEKLGTYFKAQVNDIENHNNTLLLATIDSLVYVWQKNTFKPYTALNEKIPIPDSTNIWSIYSINDENIVIETRQKETSTYYLFNTETNQSQKLPIERLIKNSIRIQSFFGVEEENKIGIGTSEGLFYLDIKNENYQKVEFNVFICKIMQADSVLFVENYTDENNNPRLNYEQNSLTFFYSSTNSLDEQNTLFRFRLNGYDTKWSEWTKETKKEYTNLDAGKYSFEVEAKNIYDTKSEVTKYDFRIKPPFYRTWGAYITYFVLLSLFVWGVIKLNLKRLQIKNIKLEEIIAERTVELRDKNEEVSQQNQQLETQQKLVETAYQNVSLLGEVGKKITSSLSVETIIEMVYSSVNQLLDASIFIIGIYNEKEQTLDFINSKEKGETLPFHQTFLRDNNFPSYCFNKNEEIIINDVQKEYHNYFPNEELKALEGEMPESLIYVPIIYKDKTIGVLTVQSFEKDSYNQNKLNLVRNISVYAAIALVNANSYQQIEEQSNAISVQNDNITASINYASRIQQAMLPPIKSIKNALENAFVLWLPRDVVSGDFYWFAEVENKVCIAAVDCTGHGVPGAFMSMIGNDMLNHIVLEKRITNPALILSHLHEQVSTALRQSETQNRDGMDMTLCVYDKTTKELEFAGAKNPLYYIQNGELKDIKGSKFPIGGKWGLERERVYENHTLKIEQETTIFLCTDGYQDQFGGNKGKKLMKKKMKSLFEEIAHLEDTKQKEKLESYFLNWKKEEEQVDDVLVMGFKVG